jgi:hypothetical protein
MKDSYDEIMDFIFPPNLSFFYDEFRVDAWDMFLSRLKSFTGAVRLRRLEQMVGKDGGNEWKSWSKSKIGIHRIYLSDGWKKRQTYLA